MLTSWQRDPQALVVEALEGLHDEAPQIQASRTDKAGIRALTYTLQRARSASRVPIN